MICKRRLSESANDAAQPIPVTKAPGRGPFRQHGPRREEGTAQLFRCHAEASVKTSTRVIVFLTLIVVYVGLVKLTGVEFLIFTSRYHGLGIDYFILADYAACFWEGPFIGPMDPYPVSYTHLTLPTIYSV